MKILKPLIDGDQMSKDEYFEEGNRPMRQDTENSAWLSQAEGLLYQPFDYEKPDGQASSIHDNEAGFEPHPQSESRMNRNVANKSNNSEFISDKVQKFALWDMPTEQKYIAWLNAKGLTNSTVIKYCKSINQIFMEYNNLALKAIRTSNTQKDAIQEFKALLNANNDYIKANRSQKYYLSASLSALEQAICDEDDNAKGKRKRGNIQKSISFEFMGIVGLDKGKAGIDGILKAHFHNLYGYSNINILWIAAQDSLFMFLNDNAINDAEKLWRLACELFDGEYFISGTGIWESEPDFLPNDIGIIINYARHYGGVVDRGQIDAYFSHIKLKAPDNSSIIQSGNFIFYMPKQFILTEMISSLRDTYSKTAIFMDKLFQNENAPFITFRDISSEWFSNLPQIQDGLGWTALLLQEVLRLFPSIGYRVVFPRPGGQLDLLGSAIVPIESEINSFSDVVYLHCIEKGLIRRKIPIGKLRESLLEAGLIENHMLIKSFHTALKDARFAFTDGNKMVRVLD